MVCTNIFLGVAKPKLVSRIIMAFCGQKRLWVGDSHGCGWGTIVGDPRRWGAPTNESTIGEKKFTSRMNLFFSCEQKEWWWGWVKRCFRPQNCEEEVPPAVVGGILVSDLDFGIAPSKLCLYCRRNVPSTTVQYSRSTTYLLPVNEFAYHCTYLFYC